MTPSRPSSERPDDNALLAALAEARSLGFLGPGPVETHLQHSLAFVALVEGQPDRVLDLGSGGGVPGLPLALYWPESRWVLLDANERRTAWLAAAVASLGLGQRVDVLCARAEEAGRSSMRGSADLVVSRSFGPPSVTAECASPFLKSGGILVVSEPPGGDPGRWSAEGLGILGMQAIRITSEPFALQGLLQSVPCPDRFPRRVGVPMKRPLF